MPDSEKIEYIPPPPPENDMVDTLRRIWLREIAKEQRWRNPLRRLFFGVDRAGSDSDDYSAISACTKDENGVIHVLGTKTFQERKRKLRPAMTIVDDPEYNPFPNAERADFEVIE